MRLLRPRHPEERAGAAAEESAGERGRDCAGAVGKPVPLHRVHQDLRRGRAGGGGDAGRVMSRKPAGSPGSEPSLAGDAPAAAPASPPVPADRMMPAERRLEPPRWPGGRARPPGREFNVIGKRNRKVEGLSNVTGRAIYADDITL